LSGVWLGVDEDICKKHVGVRFQTLLTTLNTHHNKGINILALLVTTTK
jgi:hypothetical protein